MEITVRSTEELDRAAKEFLSAAGNRRHFAFEGPMGAGKTTFIAAVCRVLDMDDEASSPTFSIVNEYVSAGTGCKVYHFDFYRIETPEEALDLGLDDYFDSGCLCLMEWPENVEPLLPDDTVTVTIGELPDGSRLVSVPD